MGKIFNLLQSTFSVIHLEESTWTRGLDNSFQKFLTVSFSYSLKNSMVTDVKTKSDLGWKRRNNSSLEE